MNGPIAQIVALTCHGNAFLHDRDMPQFLLGNSTCKFCKNIEFVRSLQWLFNGALERVMAADPNAWFAYLKTKEALAIRITNNAQNLGHGGNWAMEVMLPHDRSELWMGRWQIGNRDAPEQRIWKVRYGRISKSKTTVVPTLGLDATRAQLAQALLDIHSFSHQHNCEWFTASFAKGIDTLKSGQRHGYHNDLAPLELLTDPAAAILDACQSAWVFGGMGSWNDIIFDGEEKKAYDRVSSQLYKTVIDAICVATNATAKC